MSVWTALFGWPAAWGTGGNLVAWIICGAIAGLWLRAKLKAHHLAELAQGVRHHKALMAQAQKHHEALMAHVTATAAPPEEGM